MSRCVIDTDVLLANLFDKLENVSRISFQTVRSYLKFLRVCFPVCIITDFSDKSIIRCAEKYPNLYQIRKINEEQFVVSGEKAPNLGYFNSIYSYAVASYLENSTVLFIKEAGLA